MVILLHIILIDFGLIFFIKVTTFFSKEDKKKSKHLKNTLNYCISFYFKGPTISLKIYNIVTTKKMFIWQIKLLFTWNLLVFLIQISNKNIQIHVTVASTIDLTQKKKKNLSYCKLLPFMTLSHFVSGIKLLLLSINSSHVIWYLCKYAKHWRTVWSKSVSRKLRACPLNLKPFTSLHISRTLSVSFQLFLNKQTNTAPNTHTTHILQIQTSIRFESLYLSPWIHVL